MVLAEVCLALHFFYFATVKYFQLECGLTRQKICSSHDDGVSLFRK